MPWAVAGVSLAASLALASVAWRSVEAPPRTAEPRAAPPTSDTPEPQPAERFGVAFARRVREQLNDLNGVFVDSGGRPLPPGPGRPEGSYPLLDGDPARWGDVLRAMPEVLDFHAWVATGGQVEELSDEAVEELRRTDGFFRDLELPPVFEAFLRARPSPARIEEPALLSPLVVDLTEPGQVYQGWGATAVRALARAITAYQVRDRAIRKGGAEVPAELRRVTPSALLRLGRSLAEVLDGGFRYPSFRRAAEAWLAPVVLDLRVAFYAAGRARRRGEPQASVVAGMLRTVLVSELLGILHCHLVGVDASWLLGYAEAPPDLALLEARLVDLQGRALEALDLDPTRLQLLRARRVRALEVASLASVSLDRGWHKRHAAMELCEVRMDEGDLRGVADSYRHYRRFFPPAEGYFPLRVVTALIRAGSTLGLSRAHLAELRQEVAHSTILEEALARQSWSFRRQVHGQGVLVDAGSREEILAAFAQLSSEAEASPSQP